MIILRKTASIVRSGKRWRMSRAYNLPRMGGLVEHGISNMANHCLGKEPLVEKRKWNSVSYPRINE